MDAVATGPITMDTPLGNDLVFRAMEGAETFSVPFQFEIQATSERSDIAAKELLGASVTVHIELVGDDGAHRHWNGRVTRFEYVETGVDGVSHYRLTLRPWIWQLGLGRDWRIFQNMSVPDIVTKVFQDRGMGDFESALFETYAPLEYVVQYGESDLAFISRLLAREGIYYFFRHDDGKHTLVLADGPGAHEPAAGCEQLSYQPADQHRDQTMQYVRRWQCEAQLEPRSYALTDFDFTKPRAQLSSTRQDPDSGSDAAADVYDYPGGFSDFDAADRYAQLRLDQARRDARTWMGDTNARGLTLGRTFQLEDHPREDQNQGYLVTSARLTLRGLDPSTGTLAEGEPFACTFRVIDRNVTFRPQFSGREPRVRGPQTATVVGPDGQEMWTDSYGRVKVQFHWDRQGQYDENSSCWVRVAQVWAGAGFGTQFIPRIGQEVIVDFLDGDPDRPIITGSVYNGGNTPPFSLPDNQTQSGVRTQSTPGGNATMGNEIRFEDRTGQEDLYIHAEGTQTTLVERDQTVQIRGNRQLSVQGHEQVDVSMGRTTSVAGAESIAIGGISTLTIAGSHNTSVTGPFTAQLGGSTIQVLGPETLTVSGGSTRQVSGGQNTTIGGDGTDSIQGSRTITVGADDVLNVTAKRAVSVGAGGQDGAQDDLFVHGTYRLGAKSTITIESEKEIVLRCGSTELHLTPHSLELLAESIHAVASKEALVSGNGPSLHLADDAQLMAKKIGLMSSGAQLALADDAQLKGSKVELGSGSGGSASPPSSQTAQSGTVSLQFLDAQENPLANKTYLLEIAGVPTQGTTDGTGGVTATPPPDATVGTCTVWTEDFPDGPRVTYHLAFGPIEPPSSAKGAQLRLKNLSYYGGAIDGIVGHGTRDAILSFQHAHGLKTTGLLDADTIQKLSEIHP